MALQTRCIVPQARPQARLQLTRRPAPQPALRAARPRAARVVAMAAPEAAKYGLSEKVVTNLKAFFTKLDADTSGAVSATELDKFLDNDAAEFQFVAQYDTDKDGSVTWEEVIKSAVSAKYGLPAARVEKLKEVFDSLDKDGSGKITEEELLVYLKSSEGKVEKFKGRYDGNKDGVVTFAEFAWVFAEAKKRAAK